MAKKSDSAIIQALGIPVEETGNRTLKTVRLNRSSVDIIAQHKNTFGSESRVVDAALKYFHDNFTARKGRK